MCPRLLPWQAPCEGPRSSLFRKRGIQALGGAAQGSSVPHGAPVPRPLLSFVPGAEFLKPALADSSGLFPPSLTSGPSSEPFSFLLCGLRCMSSAGAAGPCACPAQPGPPQTEGPPRRHCGLTLCSFRVPPNTVPVFCVSVCPAGKGPAMAKSGTSGSKVGSKIPTPKGLSKSSGRTYTKR